MKIIKILMLILACGVSNYLSAHSSQISTITISKKDTAWSLHISSSFDAFYYELTKKYPKTDFNKISKEDLTDLLIKEIGFSINMTANKIDKIELKNGAVQVGHQTDLWFDIKGMPKDLKQFYIEPHTFSNIKQHNYILLMPRKETYEKFILGASNGNAMNFEWNDAHIFKQIPMENNDYFVYFGLFGIVALGFSILIINFKSRKMTKLLFSKCLAILSIIAVVGCTKTVTTVTDSVYTGTGSVTQGKATTTTANLFPSGIRVAGLGTITSKDSKTTWTVPAEVNFTTTSFPFASDLYNSYVSGHTYASTTAATAALSSNNIVTVDADGEVYTAFIFADNYFEMYVNGVAVGKDPVPFTDFNSCIVQFKAKKPFTVAIKCVDWEENLGMGTEAQGSASYHIGDGGFVAAIRNAAGTLVGVTDNSWKAQTYYIAPISDLACLKESGNARLSSSCSTVAGASDSYAIHWALPTDWFKTTYDDTNWPVAATFSNSTVGVDGKSSYTKFTDVFDNASKDASFIWSSNLLLDNLVLLRKKIE